MQAGFQDHFRAAQHGLGRQPGRDVTRQTCGDPAIAEALDKQVNIGRPAAAQAGDRIQQGFLDLKRHPNGGEKLVGQLAIFQEG